MKFLKDHFVNILICLVGFLLLRLVNQIDAKQDRIIDDIVDIKIELGIHKTKIETLEEHEKEVYKKSFLGDVFISHRLFKNEEYYLTTKKIKNAII